MIAQTGALVQRAFNSGATWLLALSAISVPVTLINGVITARALGPSSRGDYAAITAFCTVLIFMACAGVAESMILRSSSTDAASAHQALAWLHSLSLAVVFSVPSAAYAMHVGQDHRIVVFLAMTLPLVGVLGTLSVSHLIAAGSVRFASVIGVIPYVAQMVAMVGVIAIDRLTLVTVLLIYWLSSLLAGVVGGVRLWRMVDRRAQVRRSHIGAFYGELKHLGGSQILRSISSRIDLILVGAMLMSRDTGIYSVALSPVMAGTAVVGSLSPLVLKRAKGGDANMASVSVLLAVAVAVGVATVGPPFVTILYGDAYASAAPILVFLALGLAANVVFDVALRVSQAGGYLGLGLRGSMVLLTTQVIAVVGLGKGFGLQGVAIGNALGYIAGAAFLIRFGPEGMATQLSPARGIAAVRAVISGN